MGTESNPLETCGGKSNRMLSIAQKAAFGIGSFGKDLVYGLTSSFVMYFYNEVMGLSAAFVGIILLITRFLDAFNDPLVGVLVGKTHTRWGRYRPWLLSGAAINAFVLYALFAAPAFPSGSTELMVYFSVTYILWDLTYAASDIPFWSMIPAIARTPEDRESLSVIGRSCASVGSGIITGAAMILIVFLGNGNEYEGFRLLALIAAVLFFGCLTITALLFKDNADTGDASQNVWVKDMFIALVRNDQALVIIACLAMFYLSIFAASNMFIYFFKYGVGGANWNVSYSAFVSTGVVCQFIGMSTLYPVLRKKLSNTSLLVMCVVILIGCYSVLLMTCVAHLTNVMPLLLATGGCIYACNGIINVTTSLFLYNAVDYGHLKTGVREESLLVSAQIFTVKAGAGIAAFATGLGIDALGLRNASDAVTSAASNSPALLGTGLIMTLPAIVLLSVLLAFFRRKWKLDDSRSAEILEQLKNG